MQVLDNATVIAPPANGLSSMLAGFELWYQPVYDVVDGNVLHNEVLLRWRDSDGSVHLPRSFMPLVSQAGMEQQLDRYVIQKTIVFLSTIPGISLSVNLSEQAFKDFSVPEFIQDLIQQHGIAPSQLNFELSERNISRNFKSAIAFIRDLKELGCSVVLDSFANQYLTFLQWEQLNVDLVKVEGALIRDLQEDSPRSTLAKAIIDTSDALGQAAVVKSVDEFTPAQLLESMRFDSAQGYHLKRPSRQPCFASKVDILGVPIDNLSQDELLRQLQSGIVFTPNVDHLVNLRKNDEFHHAYNMADYKICDSQILVLASQFLGDPIKQRLSGSDVFPAFYQYHKDNPEISIFLLGGATEEGDAEEVAVQAQHNINRKVGRRIVVDACSPSMGFDRNEQECADIVQRINRSGATVLAIGVGAPKQEQWVYKYRDQLDTVKIIFAIGATIDFEAGKSSRAPELVSRLGVEWLYRLVSEPKRLWKRYLIDDLPFFWFLLQQKLHQ